jgi:hypothetical protein
MQEEKTHLIRSEFLCFTLGKENKWLPDNPGEEKIGTEKGRGWRWEFRAQRRWSGGWRSWWV